MKKSGIFINILILIIAILTTLLFLMSYFKNQPQEVGELISQDSNIVVTSIQAEGTDDIEDYVEESAVEEKKIAKRPVLETHDFYEEVEEYSENDTSKIYRFYYNQLDDNAKKIYKSIEDNIENIKTGSYIIQIPNEVGRVLDQENGDALINQEFQSAWDAIIMDRVDLFYIDVSKVTLEMVTTSYGKIKSYKLTMKPNQNVPTYLEDDFQSKSTINESLNRVQNKRDEIINSLSGSDYDKIVQVNDYLVDLLEYSTETGNNAYNLFGALEKRKCVCEGYAESFKYIMDELEIPCIVVIGIGKNSEGATENHEWNYVQLDGKWYGVDVTWNDPIIVGGGRINNTLKHKYLLKGIDILENHMPDGKMSTNGIEFRYPELSQYDY